MPAPDLADLRRRLAALRRKPDGQAYIADLAPFIRECGRDHALAEALWRPGEKGVDMAARDLAARIADPAAMDRAALELWLKDLDAWSITDAYTGYIVKLTPYAEEMAHLWAGRAPTYEKRAAFATVAQMAWTKTGRTADAVFIRFLPVIEAAAADSRLHVKKAVNWALRDIGKRNAALNAQAVRTARRLAASPDKTARWVAAHRAHEYMDMA